MKKESFRLGLNLKPKHQNNKINEAGAEFEAKAPEQSLKAEKEKVTLEIIRKTRLETLAETKKMKTTRSRRTKTNRSQEMKQSS